MKKRYQKRYQTYEKCTKKGTNVTNSRGMYVIQREKKKKKGMPHWTKKKERHHKARWWLKKKKSDKINKTKNNRYCTIRQTRSPGNENIVWQQKRVKKRQKKKVTRNAESRERNVSSKRCQRRRRVWEKASERQKTQKTISVDDKRVKSQPQETWDEPKMKN